MNQPAPGRSNDGAETVPERYISGNLSAGDVRKHRIALDRELVRRGGFYAFVALAWEHVPYNANTPFVPAQHINQMCLHYEATVPGSKYNPPIDFTAEGKPVYGPPLISELVCNIPPGYTKSMIFSVLSLAWVWTFRPEFRQLTASFDDAASKLNAQHCKDLVQSAWYRERWGEILDPRRSRQIGLYMTKAGGFRFSTSIGGKGTGRHGHQFVVDDPVKPPPEHLALAGDVTREIERANSWLKSVAASRTVDAKTYSQVMVMQRLAEGDPSGQMLAKKDANGAPVAVHLRLPALFEPEQACKTVLGGDWRKVKGEPLEPVRFSVETENKRARNMGGWEGPIASAQLQQQPAPPGGLIFKKETFRRFRASEFPISKTFSVLSVDCNFKKSPINSDVGITVEGIDHQNRILTYHWESSTLGWVETRQRVLDLIKIWRPNVILIEDKANGSAMIDELRTTYHLGNVLGPNPDTTKESRAHAANVSYQGQVVHHNQECLGAGNLGDVNDFEGALGKFPRGLKKDVIDAHSMAVLYLASEGANNALAAYSKMGNVAGAFARHFRLG